MSRPKTTETVVISFRVPADLGQQIDKRAKKEKKDRANLVADVFIPAFQQRLTTVKQTA